RLQSHPRWFVLPQLVLLAACITYTVTHLKFSTNRSDLVSSDERYQQNLLLLKREFKFPDNLVAMVESEDPAKNRQFVERLAQKLRSEPELFQDVYYKGDLKMMGPKALLFLPEETLEELRGALTEHAPVIETFSRVNSLNSLFDLVNAQLREAGQATATQQQVFAGALPVLRRIAEEATRSVRETGVPLTPGITALFGDRRNLYLTFSSNQIYAVLANVANEEVEKRAVERLRELVRQTQFEVTGVNAGITGEPVLDYDETQQAQRDVHRAALVSLVLVAAIFICGYHEIRRPIMATVCLLVGISYTLGFATLAVGHLNILSITLVPILIGIAIDFGVHLISRFEEELRAGKNQRAAIHKALVFAGIGIFTSGFTTAGAFLAMLFTDFKGVREMGLISGVGLLVCIVPMMTLLPLMLVRGSKELPGDCPPRQRHSRRAHIEQMWLKRPRLVLLCGAGITLLALAQMPRLNFDYNLLNLQARGLPAVDVGEKLMQSGSQSILSAAIIADSLPQAIELENRAKALPSVATVSSIVDYLTEDQTRKLETLRQIKTRIGDIHVPAPDDAPVDIDKLDRSLTSLRLVLGFVAGKIKNEPANENLVVELNAFREAVEHLQRAIGDNTNRAITSLTALQNGLLSDVRETLSLVHSQDASGPLTLEDIPPFLRERYVSPSGKFLLQVYPRGDVWERSVQKQFVQELRAVAPDVTGSPIQIYEYTSMVKESFQKAGLYAAGVIALMVLLHFRRLASVLLAFLPVLLGFIWMLGLMTVLNIPFNPVNIMSLTLVIGIGVTNSIHILNRFAEHPHPSIMATSTGKAVLVSALNTIAGFGSLLVAKHQGISSLGAVMAIGTGTCMLASLTVLPAILHFLNKFGWSMTKKKICNDG
ncbi:MAG TPA: MMPL family transporter, partial [Candidatus Acidoferrum sp.]|nr:MMPL family transporter [Candidatus Acidoferrum sp.]